MLLLKNYAAQNGYSFQDVGAIMPHEYIAKPFFINLTHVETQIVVTNIGNEQAFLLVIRGSRSGLDRPGKFVKLLDKIRGEWPDLHSYVGP